VEETLVTEGRHELVTRQRDVFQEIMRDRFVEVVEDELGRRVLAFMSASTLEPDVLAELFVLEPEAGPGG
jgi:uncharacterized protein YbcI